MILYLLILTYEFVTMKSDNSEFFRNDNEIMKQLVDTYSITSYFLRKVAILMNLNWQKVVFLYNYFIDSKISIIIRRFSKG